jgi:glycerophosphoryl diester phosphodiesterase
VILIDPDARPLIGHRGASGSLPENTIPSFDAALEQGADAFELDVHVARDGVPVVIHDPTLDRTTDASGPVSLLTAAELQMVDAGEGASVPTLAEVLRRYPTTPMIVEIKERAATDGVIDVLRQLDAVDRVLLGAFEHAALAPARSGLFHLSASRRQTGWVWAAARVGLALGGAFESFTIPEFRGSLRVVDRRFLAAARKLGKPVHVWTVDTVEDAGRLRAMGVAGIITNFPSRLRDIDRGV